MTASRQGIVLKVGGSLLEWPGLAEAMPRLLDAARAEFGPPIVVVGGGKFVDEIRRLDRILRLATSPIHQLAIRALDVTAHLLPVLVPAVPWTVVQTDAEFQVAMAKSRVPILTPWR